MKSVDVLPSESYGSAALEFVDAAAVVLAGHASYTRNKDGTRIRCNGKECLTILEAPGGEGNAVLIFALHQAENLPRPTALLPPAVAVSPEAPASGNSSSPGPEPDTSPETDAVITDDGTPAESWQQPREPVETEVKEKITKTRRDTKALTAIIAEINNGDRVAASFKHPRYGEFTVEGTVIQGGAGLDRNQLAVGGWYLNIGARAAKYLQELIILATAGTHEFAVPKPSEVTEHIGIGA